MERVCDIVDATPGSEKYVYETIEGFRRAIKGMSSLPEEVAEEMWSLLLLFFRKILTASVMGNMDDKAGQYIREMQDGFKGRLKAEVERNRS